MFTQKILLGLAAAILAVGCEGDNGNLIKSEINLEKSTWEIGVRERENLEANTGVNIQYAETIVRLFGKPIAFRVECSVGKKIALHMEGESLPDLAVPRFIEPQGEWLNQINGAVINTKKENPVEFQIHFSQDPSKKNLFIALLDKDFAKRNLIDSDFSLNIQLIGRYTLKGSLANLSDFFRNC
jgi:hypothetical protein